VAHAGRDVPQEHFAGFRSLQVDRFDFERLACLKGYRCACFHRYCSAPSLHALFDSMPDVRTIAPRATVPAAAGALQRRSSRVHKIL
jgi:hypothetical protein